MSNFTSRLNYSFGNEDWRTEQRALKIQPQDRVLCVTASGDRPLNLLMNECKEIVTVDCNQQQTHLLALKMAAMMHLNYSSYLSFLGATSERANRLEMLKEMNFDMSPDAYDFWMTHPKSVTAGVLYQGNIEKITKWISSTMKLLRPSKVRKLFSFNDLDQQREFVDNEWDSPMMKKCFDFFLRPWFSQFFLKDPGLFLHVAPDLSVGNYLYQRIQHCLYNSLAKESSLLCLIFQGKVGHEGFPPYLTKEGFEVIKPRLDRLKAHTSDLISFLRSSPDNYFDAFSLSDVASYISVEQFHLLLHEVHRTAKPEARFSIRQLFTNRHIPVSLKRSFVRDTQLENQLESQDNCFVYTFMVGKISKNM